MVEVVRVNPIVNLLAGQLNIELKHTLTLPKAEESARFRW